MDHPCGIYSSALEEVLSDLKRGQQAVHQWGAKNRVSFGPGREVFAVVHHRFAHGSVFKLLGAIFDTKLSMTPCVEAMRRVTPKIRALLRARPCYSTSDLVRQYKTLVLGLAEANAGAIYLATQTVLEPLDHSLDSFLRDLPLDARSVNMAPMSMRREIATLVFLLERVLGDAHRDICMQFTTFVPGA